MSQSEFRISRLMCICLTQTWTLPDDDLGIHTSADLLATSLFLLFSFHKQKIIKIKNLQQKNLKSKGTAPLSE